MMYAFAEENVFSLNGKNYKIHGSAHKGKVKIGLREFDVIHGILFYDGRVVRNVSMLGAKVCTENSPITGEIYFKVVETLEKIGSRPIKTSITPPKISPNEYPWKLQQEFDYNGHKIVVEKHVASTSVQYYGKNVDITLSFANFPKDKNKRVYTVGVTVGPFGKVMLFNAKNDTITTAIDSWLIRRNMSIDDFIGTLLGLDGLNWPGTNVPFIAKRDSAGRKKIDGVIVGGTATSLIVYKNGVMYLTNNDGHIIATLFATNVGFDLISDSDGVRLKIGPNIIRMQQIPTLKSVLENIDLAESINENRDLFSEFQILEF